MSANKVLYQLKPNRYYFNITWMFLYLLFFGSTVISLTPLDFLYEILVYVYFLLIIVFGIVYFLDKLVNKHKFSQIDIVVLIYFFIPIYPAFMANQAFGQSMLSGLVTVEKWNIPLIWSCFIYYMLRQNKITIEEYNRAMLVICWVSLLLYIYLMNTLNPAMYQDTNLVGYNPAKGGWVFRFSTAYIVYGICFYFLEFMFFKKAWSLLLFGGLMSYLIFVDKSRITIVVTFGTLMLYMLYALPFLKMISRILYLAVIFGFMFFIVYLIDPDLLDIIFGMFQNFFLALLGVDTGEGSADMRWIEMAKVWDYFDKHPGQIILGAGQLNHDGMDLYFSNVYFTDIGIVGILLVYGIVGTALQYMYFIYGLYLCYGNKYFKNHLLFHNAKLGLLMMFTTSFFTGGFVFTPTSLVNIFILLHFYKIEDMKVKYLKSLEYAS